jgi:hypothetical protein
MKGKKTGGRVKGSINESTKQLNTVKEVVLKTFFKREENSKTSLEAFAEEYPKEFYNIAAKLIQTEVKAVVEVIKAELPPFMKSNESES